MVVTGAAGLIGSALTESFLAAGATVHALDNNTRGLADLEFSRAALSAGRRLHTLSIDLADPAAIAAVGCSLERLDILVNNVGANDDRQGVEALDAESWRSVLDVNLVGPALLTGALTPLLKASSAASVVFVTSINAVDVSPWLHYAAAKAGLSKLTTDLAHDLVSDGVRVNAVAPGRVVGTQRPADDDRATARHHRCAPPWWPDRAVTSSHQSERCRHGSVVTGCAAKCKSGQRKLWTAQAEAARQVTARQVTAMIRPCCASVLIPVSSTHKQS